MVHVIHTVNLITVNAVNFNHVKSLVSCSILRHSHFKVLAMVRFYQFIELKDKIEVLNCKNHSQPLFLSTKWLWKFAFAIYLEIFLSKFSLKLWGKTLIMLKLTLWQSLWEWITCNVKFLKTLFRLSKSWNIQKNL